MCMCKNWTEVHSFRLSKQRFPLNKWLKNAVLYWCDFCFFLKLDYLSFFSWCFPEAESFWFTHSAVCWVLLAVETAPINKTAGRSVHSAIKYWSWPSLHHFGLWAFFTLSCWGGMPACRPACLSVAPQYLKHAWDSDDIYSLSINQTCQMDAGML